MDLDPSTPTQPRRPSGLLPTTMRSRRSSTDHRATRPGADETLRLLFIGNGVAHGWGATSGHVAATGELAKGISAITGAECEIEFVGDEASNVDAAVARIADHAGTAFHGAVVAIGANHAMRLTPVADWGARLVNVLNAVHTGLVHGAPVILIGVPDVHVPNRIRSLHPLALAHARRLDQVARRLAAVRPHVTYLPAPRLFSMAGLRPGRALDAAFSRPIAAAVAAAVRDAQLTTGPLGGARWFDRPEVRAMVEAADDDLAALRSVVRRAAAEFHVQEAMVNLLDGDRTWRVGNTGSDPFSAPRALTYCETVVATGEPLVVEDASRDSRFTERAYLHLSHAEFYAGVPIHADDGTAIGAMCLLNPDPRSAQSTDLGRLREFAHEVELIIRAATAAADQLALVPAI